MFDVLLIQLHQPSFLRHIHVGFKNILQRFVAIRFFLVKLQGAGEAGGNTGTAADAPIFQGPGKLFAAIAVGNSRFTGPTLALTPRLV
jgi:hypothetical protein